MSPRTEKVRKRNSKISMRLTKFWAIQPIAKNTIAWEWIGIKPLLPPAPAPVMDLALKATRNRMWSITLMGPGSVISSRNSLAGVPDLEVRFDLVAAEAVPRKELNAGTISKGISWLLWKK